MTCLFITVAFYFCFTGFVHLKPTFFLGRVKMEKKKKRKKEHSGSNKLAVLVEASLGNGMKSSPCCEARE